MSWFFFSVISLSDLFTFASANSMACHHTPASATNNSYSIKPLPSIIHNPTWSIPWQLLRLICLPRLTGLPGLPTCLPPILLFIYRQYIKIIIIIISTSYFQLINNLYSEVEVHVFFFFSMDKNFN